jgi:hypothetical protein
MLSQNSIHQNLPSFIRRVFVLLVGRVLHRVFEPLCRLWRMDPIMSTVVSKSAFRTCIRRCSGQALGSSGTATHVLQMVDSASSQRPTMVQLVCFGPCFLQGLQLFLVMPPQQSKISGKHVFLYLPSLKEHIPVFIIFFRPKLQELRGVEVAPPLSTGAKTYQLYHRRRQFKRINTVSVKPQSQER